MSNSLLDRLSDKFLVGDGCWEWIAARSGSGYGRLNVEGRSVPAYRVMYEVFVGPIPEKFDVDHLCRNPSCVRPDHLEAVTHAENIRRGMVLVRATHCKAGHEFTEENTIVKSSGQRDCRECQRRWGREYMRRKRASHGSQ